MFARSREHAVVIGGSMAGLLAARALATHFRRVTLLERDPLPLGADHRRGVPQGRHAHALLDGGRGALEALLPGVSRELLDAGAQVGDVSSDTHWLFEGGELASAPSGVRGFCVSRPLVEATVRARVRALDNVEIRDSTPVARPTSLSGAVTGVEIEGGETVAADLTVDAAGRGSRAGKWLQELDFPAPAEEVVEVGLRYTTRHFRRRPEDLGGRLAAVIPPTPQGKRGGVILAQEGGRWIVTLLAHFLDGAPEDLDGFIAYARNLQAPWIHDVIRDAEPLGEPSTIRYPASRRRRYERLDRFPAGFLVLGDGVCSFNPIYGQGMSSAALQAVALGAALAEGDGDLARRFFARAARVVDNPWAVAVGNDLKMPEVNAPRPAMTRFVNWYVAKLHRAAHHDPSLAHVFLRVTNLAAPPESMLAPAVALRVLLGSVRRSSAGVSPVAARS